MVVVGGANAGYVINSLAVLVNTGDMKNSLASNGVGNNSPAVVGGVSSQ